MKHRAAARAPRRNASRTTPRAPSESRSRASSRITSGTSSGTPAGTTSRTTSSTTRTVTARAARKGETHQRILKSAAAVARREGLAAASVPRVMSGAGLTVGGFYAHFDSKTALDAELIRTMLGTTPGRWLDGLDDSAGLEWLARAVGRYLSEGHRENVDGCGYPAVISEVSRSGPDVRAAFAEAVELRVRTLAVHAPELPGVAPRERALATLALLVGGLLLARATRGLAHTTPGNALSDEMLAACRKWALPEHDGNSPGRSI